MKNKIIIFLLLLIGSFVFSDTNIMTVNGTKIEIKYDEKTPDIWVYIEQNKIKDSYLIEAIGPDCRIDSIFTDIIKGNIVIFVKVYLGNPGGRQSVDVHELHVLEITKDNKIKALLTNELVNLTYSVPSDKFISSKVNFFNYNFETKEITIYDTYNYSFKKIETIKLYDIVE